MNWKCLGWGDYLWSTYSHTFISQGLRRLRHEDKSPSAACLKRKKGKRQGLWEHSSVVECVPGMYKSLGTTHTHKPMYIHAHICTYTCINISNIYMYIHMHRYTYIHKYTCTHKQYTHNYMHMYTYIHRYTYIHKYTYAHIYTHRHCLSIEYV